MATLNLVFRRRMMIDENTNFLGVWQQSLTVVQQRLADNIICSCQCENMK